MKMLGPLILPIMLVSPIAAEERWCHPRENAARVLSKPAPNAIHKDWGGESYIGLAWSLKPKTRVRESQLVFIQGDLYSPRGAVANKDVYVLASEWTCE